MKRTSLLTTALLLLSLQTMALATDGGALVTEQFSPVETKLEEVLAHTRPEKVLVVYDIDNTILKTKQDLGSEHWFLWQKELIDKGVKIAPVVADTAANLLRIQSAIYAVSGMEPTDAAIPRFTQHLKDLGVARITLTSRGFDTRDATLRELDHNGYQLSSAAELGIAPLASPYLPYDLMDVGKNGLDSSDVQKFGLKAARPVYFERGMFLTEGQHKGVMLKTLLARTHRKFDVILFVDDRPHHIQGMRDAFQDRRETVYAFQFVKGKQWIEAFQQSDKASAQAAWCQFSGFLTGTGLELPGMVSCL